MKSRKPKTDTVNFEFAEMAIAYSRWRTLVRHKTGEWFIKYLEEAGWDGEDMWRRAYHFEVPPEVAHKINLLLSPQWKTLYRAQRKALYKPPPRIAKGRKDR